MRPALAAALAAWLSNAAPARAARAGHGAGAEASPVEKVITLLTDLRGKVYAEGDREAATYDAFACFCKDTTAAKSAAISEGETRKQTLAANLYYSMRMRDTEEASFGEKEQAIRTLHEEIKTLKAERHADALEYAKSEVDLTHALQGLEAAIHALKAAKTATATGLLELRKLAPAIRSAVSMAEALDAGPAARRAAAALAQAGEIPDSVYAFHADEIISTLEELKTQFMAKKTEISDEEATAKGTFHGVLQEKESAITEETTASESHQKKISQESQNVASASRDLTTTAAQLLDDQRFLAELSGKCQRKAALWDQRAQARRNELAAITGALQALQSPLMQPAPVAAKPAALVKLGQTGRQSQLAGRLRGVRSHSEPVDWRSQAAALLRTQAAELHSPLLLNLAAQVTEDPFGKVRQLLQGLIDRLLKEAQSETNHKGWCDTQIGLAEQERDHSSESLREVNSQLEVGEAHVAKLSTLIQELDEELESLNTTLENSTAIREQEKAENEAAIEDAEQGLGNVSLAIDTLEKFYKEAANNATTLLLPLMLEAEEARGELQQVRSMRGAANDTSAQGESTKVEAPAAKNGTASPMPVALSAREALRAKRLARDVQEVASASSATNATDEPDAGFDEAYAGNQDAQASIMGMLEVIKSDFEKAIQQTKQAEAKAQQDFLELQRASGASLAAKGEAKKEREAALSSANATNSEDRASAVTLKQRIDNALVSLEALHGSCSGAGMTAEERKMQREEEMAALRRALCLLEHHGVAGAESC